MAAYKVIQDVEAEDKLLGPLTLRQFIYAGAAAITLYLSYFFTTHHASFMLVIFLPFAAVCAFFAFPWGRDQPTEIWALAKIRFMLKPRRRIWDQSGAKNLVSVTAPKQTQADYTNGLSQTEVKSRLHALADTIDSRGWVIKNSNLNLTSQPALVMAEPASDRLVSSSSLPQQVSDIDVQAADDMLDEKNNARAQAVDSMIEASAKAHRDQIVENLRQNVTAPQPAQPTVPTPQPPQQPASLNAGPTRGPQGGSTRADNYWFLNQPARAANIPANMVTFNTQVVTPGMAEAEIPNAPLAPNTDEQNLVQALDAKRQEMPTTAYYSHLHTIQPLSTQPQQQMTPLQPPVQDTNITPTSIAQAVANGLPMPQKTVPSIAQPVATPPTAPPPVTPNQQAAILQLANNNDLNVATLAREADRAASDEVVIKLH
jgi:hypothetical protein